MGERRRAIQTWAWRLLRNNMIPVMLGGAIGTYLRYLIGSWFKSQPWGQVFPYGTLFINTAGSFILGLVGVIILEGLPPGGHGWYRLIGTGFCGGFTTFSTFEWETLQLVRYGSWWYALANVAASVAAGFVGVVLGVLAAGVLIARQ